MDTVVWWNSLGLELQVFYALAITATLLVAIQMFLTLLGLGDAAVDFDVPDSGHPSTGLGFFSFQTIATFFLGFGWTGVVGTEFGLPLFATVFAAFALGGSLMTGMYFLLAALLSLQSQGNLDYRNAIGSTAEVYTTLPGTGTDGGGQVQVLLQGRLITASARKNSPGSVPPGATVRIVELQPPALFVVEPEPAAPSAPPVSPP